jgi:hypothetical protein
VPAQIAFSNGSQNKVLVKLEILVIFFNKFHKKTYTLAKQKCTHIFSSCFHEKVTENRENSSKNENSAHGNYFTNRTFHNRSFTLENRNRSKQ